MKILITGSSGLIGSEAVKYYCELGHEVIGFDNNMRQFFFGEKGSTLWMKDKLMSKYQNFKSFNIDIRNMDDMKKFFIENEFDLIIHCAAQPSHDKAAEIPIIDFQVNALGTINLLELTRQNCPNAVFIFMSTNKVYGDAPNEIDFIELETRYDIPNNGAIDETMRIDQSTHSIFGVSKTSADLMVQEYGKYFGLNTGVFRGGCLTGPNHSGVKLHGFLSYLINCCVHDEPYVINGYKGKQVRDNIHSCDVIQAFECFRKNPRPGEVYNIGGCRENSISIIEAISSIERITGKQINYTLSDIPRKGDHQCYISDMSKFKLHYPNYTITKNIDNILEEIIKSNCIYGGL